MHPNMLKREVEKVIHDLLAIIGQVHELKADTTAIRLDLDKLLKIFERRWVEAGGEG
jgi:hypothetical protein